MEKQRYKGILYIICSAFCFAPVSYTHLTLPTKHAV